MPGVDPKFMQDLPDIGVNFVSPEYFATLGTRIVRGRGFTADDRAGAPGAVVVSSTLARTLWPGEEAIGQCMRPDGGGLPEEQRGEIARQPCSYVVGVAEDIKHTSVRGGSGLYLYLPSAQQSGDRWRELAVRTRGDAAR